jgi:hypothetical protein
MLVVAEEEHTRVVGVGVEDKLVVEEVGLRMIVVEQEQALDMDEDTVEEQDKVEELEQVEILVVE